MDFARSDIQTMLVDSAERLLGKDAGVDYWRHQRTSADGFDRNRWAQFAELGWLALPLPEKVGGLDGRIEDIVLLNIELGRALATEPYAGTIVAAAHILARRADDETVAGLLSAIAAGESIVAVAHQEPGGDPIGPVAGGTSARRSGEGFLLSGSKILVPDAGAADPIIVSAHVEGEDGLSLFLVDRATAGVTVQTYPLVDGSRAADIVFSDVLLPTSALLAGGNAGAALLAEAIDRASIALMAQAVGSMEACLGLCGTYVKERKQFGVAIGSFQAIQHMLADMFVAANQARSILYHAAAHADAPAEERAAAVSAARIVIGEASQIVSRGGIQLHGGYGLTDEYAISHHYRRLMVLEKLHGDLDRHIRRFGAHV